jgi:peptidoglycan/xylan/chitin deacetylase (PgdA/CDA1 family)
VAGEPTIHELSRQIERVSPAAQSEVRDSLLMLLSQVGEPQGMPIEHVGVLARAFEVGFHTRGHYRLVSLPDSDLVEAVTAGRDVLERAARRRIDLIAYPYGAADARVAAAARDAGYSAGFVGAGVALRRNTDPLLQPRVRPSSGSLGHFALSLARALLPARHM